jgi:hypothetical protein
VAISSQTRKVLWARSGNQCARCKAALIAPEEIAPGKPAVIGEECHIIALAIEGPRGREGPRIDLDDHENLILLCSNCHALVDARPDLFPREELLRIKGEHEKQVAQRSQEPIRPRLKLVNPQEPVRLERMDDGDQLIRVLANSLSHTHETSSGLSTSQLELVGNFLQEAFDWSEIYGDIGPKGHFDAAVRLRELLEELRSQGLVVFAGYRRMELTGGNGPPEPWLNVHVKVVHEDEVRRSSSAEATARA